MFYSFTQPGLFSSQSDAKIPFISLCEIVRSQLILFSILKGMGFAGFNNDSFQKKMIPFVFMF